MPAPDPRANPILLGHPEAEATILDAVRAGRMHHAWLITGPEGVGKATLAYRFARRLLAGRPAEDTLGLPAAPPPLPRAAPPPPPPRAPGRGHSGARRRHPRLPPRRRRLARRPADDRAWDQREDQAHA